MFVQSVPKDGCLSSVPAGELSNADLDFLDYDGRQIKARTGYAAAPGRHVGIGFLRAALAQLRDNIGIEQVN